MKKIEIFDPAMCCSTGVCGPSINPKLMQIATIVNSLSKKGIDITRYGLSDEPQSFIANKIISDLLQKGGADTLPITLLDNVVVKTKSYPTAAELSEWLDIKITITEKPSGCCHKSSGCC